MIIYLTKKINKNKNIIGEKIINYAQNIIIAKFILGPKTDNLLVEHFTFIFF